MEDKIIIKKLNLKYQSKENDKVINVFNDADFEIDTKKITALVGYSGSGKTSLLRCIIGLEKNYSGEIEIPNNISMGIVFQEDRLLPWLNVEENILFGLKKNKDIKDILNYIKLEGCEKMYPYELSGGMRQRVAIARTLVRDINFILMDEPFSALDQFTKRQMQNEMIDLKNKFEIGAIFVTHSLGDAVFMADNIIVIDKGKLLKTFDVNENNKNNIKKDLLDIFKS